MREILEAGAIVLGVTVIGSLAVGVVAAAAIGILYLVSLV